MRLKSPGNVTRMPKGLDIYELFNSFFGAFKALMMMRMNPFTFFCSLYQHDAIIKINTFMRFSLCNPERQAEYARIRLPAFLLHMMKQMHQRNP